MRRTRWSWEERLLTQQFPEIWMISDPKKHMFERWPDDRGAFRNRQNKPANSS